MYAEMAQSFEEGDERALSFYFKTFYPALTMYAFKLTQDRGIAEEIAADAFIKTWKMHAKLNSYFGIKSYLYKVVFRDSLAVIAKNKKRKEQPKEGIEAIDHLTAMDKLIGTEVYRLIHSALKNLSPGNRKVMIMHYLDGKSTGEISRELQLHPSTIKTQKKQGLAALKKVILKPIGLLLYVFSKYFITFQ